MKKEVKFFVLGLVFASIISSVFIIVFYRDGDTLSQKHVNNPKNNELKRTIYNGNPSKDDNENGPQVYVSPDQSHLIYVYYESGEGCSWPAKAILYKLPFEDNPKGKEIITSEHYSWCKNSQRYVVQITGGDDVGINDNIVIKSRMIMVDLNGNTYNIPGYGTSPIFDWEDIYYYCEYSDTGDLIAPTIMSYNVITKERKTIYTFEKNYTFWPEQIDSLSIPIMEIVDHGIRGEIYPKENHGLGEYYRFFVSLSGELIKFDKH